MNHRQLLTSRFVVVSGTSGSVWSKVTIRGLSSKFLFFPTSVLPTTHLVQSFLQLVHWHQKHLRLQRSLLVHMLQRRLLKILKKVPRIKVEDHKHSRCIDFSHNAKEKCLHSLPAAAAATSSSACVSGGVSTTLASSSFKGG